MRLWSVTNWVPGEAINKSLDRLQIPAFVVNQWMLNQAKESRD